MTFDELELASALVKRRGALLALLAVVNRDASRSRLCLTAPGENEIIKEELGLEPDEVRAMLATRVSQIDAELGKLCVYPPPVNAP